MSGEDAIPEVEIAGANTHTRRLSASRSEMECNDETDDGSQDLLECEESGTSWFGAVFLIVNAALGAGLLDIPSAFNQAGGILWALGIQTFLLFFASASLLILAFCAKRHGCSTYQQVVQFVCGRRLEFWCSLVIALYCYGTCITFLVIIGDMSDRVFASLYGSDFCHHLFMNRVFIITISSTFLILPMCVSRKIDFLKYPSSLGVVAVLYLVFLIVYQYYAGKNIIAPVEIRTSPRDIKDVLAVLPVICFGYQCHVSSVPIYSCLKDKRVKTFSKSIFAALALCVFVYSLAGIFGYLTFGTNVPSDVLLEYDANDPLVLIGLLALALKIVTTYPILAFCGRLALQDLVVRFRNPAIAAVHPTSRAELVRRVMTSLIWFVTSLFAACVIPNIRVAIQAIGSMAALFILVFPGLCLLHLFIREDPLYFGRKTKVVIVYSIVTVAIGMFIFGQVLTESIQDLIEGTSDKNDLNLCV